MFGNQIIITSSGNIDYQYEREICCKWLNSCGFPVSSYEYGKSKGFYFVNKENLRKKVYICSTRNLGISTKGNFWFGFPSSHISGNADTEIIFIFVWENRIRNYLFLNNQEVLRWRNLWYLKDNHFSIDFFVEHGKYLMKTNQKLSFDYSYALNDISHLFER